MDEEGVSGYTGVVMFLFSADVSPIPGDPSLIFSIMDGAV